MTDHEIAIHSVSRITGVSTSRILSRSREWPVVEARRIVVLILHEEGLPDLTISYVLRRGRGAILKIRHVATDYRDVSKVFNDKYLKSKNLYEHEKSLRNA